MSASRFIASKLNKGGSGRLSGTSNTIAWVSVALSIAIMTIAVAVVAGFKYEIRAKVTGFMGSVMLVQPGQSPINEHYPFSDSLSYLDKIQALPSVQSCNGVAYRSGLIKTDKEIDGLYFKGVDSLYNLSFFESSLYEGSVPDYHGRISNDVMISRRTATKLGFKVGDPMVVYFVGDDIKVRKFNVCGIFDAQIDEVDTKIGLADIRQVQRLNGWSKNEVSTMEIDISPKADISLMRSQIEKTETENLTDSDTALFVTDIKSLYGHLFDWLSLLDLNVMMILVLMIVVAGFNMISAILIILFEKISMIGLLKSLGMTSKEVGRVFLARAASIVGKGMLWGNVAGLAICLVQKYTHVLKLNPENYFVKFVPIHLNVLSLVLMNIIAAVLIMAIVSLSSRFVSKVSPDRTMRVE